MITYEYWIRPQGVAQSHGDVYKRWECKRRTAKTDAQATDLFLISLRLIGPSDVAKGIGGIAYSRVSKPGAYSIPLLRYRGEVLEHNQRGGVTKWAWNLVGTEMDEAPIRVEGGKK